MKNKKAIGIFFVLLGILAGLRALDITMMHGSMQNVRDQALRLRFVLNEYECGIVKNTLQFSCNRRNVALTSWRLSPPIKDVASPLFKRNIRLIPRSCEGVLGVHNLPDEGNAHLMVSCLVAYRNGVIKPFLKSIPLPTKLPHTNYTHGTGLPSMIGGVYFSEEIKTISGVPIVDLERDLEPVRQLQKWWERLYAVSIEIIKKLYSERVVFVLFVFLALCWLKYRVAWGWIIMPLSARWERELRNAAAFFLLIFLVYAVRSVISRVYILYSLSVLCIMGMWYTLSTVTREDTFLDRCKSLIGFFLGSLVLPLLLKGYLVYVGY